jgi:hypothetical protein
MLRVTKSSTYARCLLSPTILFFSILMSSSSRTSGFEGSAEPRSWLYTISRGEGASADCPFRLIGRYATCTRVRDERKSVRGMRAKRVIYNMFYGGEDVAACPEPATCLLFPDSSDGKGIQPIISKVPAIASYYNRKSFTLTITRQWPPTFLFRAQEPNAVAVYLIPSRQAIGRSSQHYR